MSNPVPQHDPSRGHDLSRGMAMLTTVVAPQITPMLEAADTIEVIAHPDNRLWLEHAGAHSPQ